MESRSRYIDALRVRSFSGLLATRTLSILAISLRIIAVSVLVLQTTGSPLWAGIAFGAGFAPQVIGGLTLLSLADRLPLRTALVLGAGIEAAVALVIAAVADNTVVVLVVLALAAVVAPVPSASAAGAVPRLLSGDLFVLGRSMLVLTSAAAQIAGLGMGGLLLAGLGPREVLLLVAAGHAAAAATAVLTLPTIRPGSPGLPIPSLTTTIRRTMAVNGSLLADRAIRRLLMLQAWPPALVTGAEGIVAAYAVQIQVPAWAVGLLLSSVPAGMAIGTAVVGRWLRPSRRERLTGWLIVLAAVPLVLFLLRPPLPVAVAMLVLAGCGTAFELGLQRRFLEHLPARHTGQAYGLLGLTLTLGQGLMPMAAGALAALTTPAAAIAAAGAGILVILVVYRRTLAVPPPIPPPSSPASALDPDVDAAAPSPPGRSIS